MPPDENPLMAPDVNVNIEPPATPAPDPAPATPAPTADPDTFDRPYVENLRQEAARYRTEAKTFKDAFEGTDDDSRAFLLELNKQLINNPAEAAPELIRIAKQIAGDDFEKLTNPDVPLTQAQLDKQLADRDRARAAEEQQQNSVQAVLNDAKKLGYEENTPDMAMLLFHAHNSDDGDLSKAHEQVKAFKDSIIQQHIKDVAERNSGFPSLVTTAGAAPAEQEGGAPKTLGDASKALRAALGAA